MLAPYLVELDQPADNGSTPSCRGSRQHVPVMQLHATGEHLPEGRGVYGMFAIMMEHGEISARFQERYERAAAHQGNRRPTDLKQVRRPRTRGTPSQHCAVLLSHLADSPTPPAHARARCRQVSAVVMRALHKARVPPKNAMALK